MQALIVLTIKLKVEEHKKLKEKFDKEEVKEYAFDVNERNDF